MEQVVFIMLISVTMLFSTFPAMGLLPPHSRR